MAGKPTASITLTELPGANPLYRIDLRGANGKPMLSRRFREQHIAIGMAVYAGQQLNIKPDLFIRERDDDTDDESDD